MFKKIKEFFVGKPASERHALDAVTTPAVPYKVETPSATYDVPPAPGVTTLLFVPEAAPAPVTEQLVVDAAEAPAVQEAPAKKPRKPRTPKVAVVEAKPVKEKAPAKAKAPKLTVIKTAKTKAKLKKA